MNIKYLNSNIYQTEGDAIEKSLESKDEIINMKKIVKISVKNLGNQDERDMSVTFFNKSGSAEVTNSKRNEVDLAFIESFIKKDISISPQDIKNSYRFSEVKIKTINDL